MDYEAIIAIVERGKANAIVKEAVKAGARGATIVFGRGSGEHVLSFFRSLQIEPAKEIIAIIVSQSESGPIYDAVVKAARVLENGKGIAFTFPIDRLAGIDDT